MTMFFYIPDVIVGLNYTFSYEILKSYFNQILNIFNQEKYKKIK